MATTQRLGCQKITILAVSFLSCNIERDMSSIRWNFKISFHGYLVAMVTKHFLKICLHFKFASLSGNIATTIITFGAQDSQQTYLLWKSIPNMCIVRRFPWKYFIVSNDSEMPFAVKSPFTIGRAILKPS